VTLIVPVAFCPHPDEHVKLAVDNRKGVQAIVFCDMCSGSWTADKIPIELLDRCLRLFEGMQS